MRNLHLEETGDDSIVDMDELAELESDIEEDADAEPDSEFKSTDDEEVEEVEDNTDVN